MKILSIGNSFSQDSQRYLYDFDIPVTKEEREIVIKAVNMAFNAKK